MTRNEISITKGPGIWHMILALFDALNGGAGGVRTITFTYVADDGFDAYFRVEVFGIMRPRRSESEWRMWTILGETLEGHEHFGTRDVKIRYDVTHHTGVIMADAEATV